MILFIYCLSSKLWETLDSLKQLNQVVLFYARTFQQVINNTAVMLMSSYDLQRQTRSSVRGTTPSLSFCLNWYPAHMQSCLLYFCAFCAGFWTAHYEQYLLACKLQIFLNQLLLKRKRQSLSDWGAWFSFVGGFRGSV